MKKSLLFTSLLMLAAFCGFAQKWNGITSSSPVAIQSKLVSSSEDEIVVDVTVGGFYLYSVNTPDGKMMTVGMDGMVSMLEAGAPDLPKTAIPVIVGDNAEMTVSVVKSEYTDYKDIEIAPSKGNFSRQINPDDVPYIYGEMYGENAFYPAEQAYLETPYILRDFRGQNIMVRPFSYNPVTKTLRVYTNMTIAMTKVSGNGVNQKVTRRGIAKMAPEMNAEYGRRFINYAESAARYIFIPDEGEMIVICPEQYMEAMQPYVDWKNLSGRPTTMVSVADAGGNSDTQIKSYLQGIYNDPERNLMFILLVGDYADITPHSMSGGRSDNWFGQLEGTDYYVEALTGRFSVSNVTDVETHVNKVLYYERDMQDDATWVSTGVGIGANEGNGNGHNGGEADYVHINYVRDTLLHYTYTTVTQQYSGVGSGTNAAAISADFNNGASICNYCNHGSQTSWAVANYSNSNVNALVNDYKWPYIWSVACNNGEFNGTCFGEAWMRATNNSTGVPTGAIGGMFSWISQPWRPPMTGQDEMVDILTGWKSSDQFNHTFGGVSLNGNMYILDMHPEDSGETHNTWILFGDPSLMVRTANPTNMNVSLNPGALLIGMSELNITADVEYGIATLSMNGEVLGSAKVLDGQATLTFDPLTTVGDATLTILGYNRVTYNETIEVIPAEGSYLTVYDYTPNFAPVNQEMGLSVSFKNVGTDPTTGDTQVTLSCDDDRINIINGTATLDVIAGNEVVDVDGEFSFIVNEGVEDGTKFNIDVTMTCGSETWTGKAIVTAGQAILSFESFATAGGFVPGESVTIAANFKNVGHYMATNVIATASSTSEYVTFETDLVEIGTIDPDGVATCVFTFNVSDDCPETEQLPISFNITADGGLEAEGNGVVKNACVVIFTLNDSYGDGWNGNKLHVVYSDGTPAEDMTINSGSSETFEREIGNGVHVTVTFIQGQWSTECSYTIKYEDGTSIFSGTTNGCEFDVNCGGGITGNFEPVYNLEATLDGHVVTLTWEAPDGALEYIVSRNGVVIDEIEETSYTDEVNIEMVYTYSVVAVYADGESMPEVLVVEVDLGLEENETIFSVYPNPASNTLYINGGNAEYSYSIFNGMGQQIINGTANGVHQVNVSGMAKGVYFLRLTTGAQVSIQKITVE